MSANPKHKNLESLKNEFKVVCDSLCVFMNKNGIAINSYKSPDMEEFQKLDDENKVIILNRAKQLLEIYSECEASGEKLKDSPKLVWRALSKMKLTPSSDIFEKMNEDLVITIYNLSQNQIFRTLGYFETLSATFEEVCTRTWRELHHYPEDVLVTVDQIPEAVYAGLIQETTPIDIPAFVVVDALGPDKIRTEIKMEWMSPIRNDNEIVGLITATRVNVLG